ncbi:hypothetical protein MNEG_14373 [Monoraphidium neglectum]|uniref:Uncharacterized protein n=1 Tax=Monoraphidium neglectum TaxID=145388 RepID=A0A0D2MEK8_9CHLO|nr:hypothetical protein MNEG_14373 [Monoraphidium neglectum]KIY93590.1 hypothetical protein MNEG_14373 [Monoraphidium neglectum]|eukprot:XP_013892610.1 hypothetical protein MNEG_14373 [Monoraphidium neglectum]
MPGLLPGMTPEERAAAPAALLGVSRDYWADVHTDQPSDFGLPETICFSPGAARGTSSGGSGVGSGGGSGGSGSSGDTGWCFAVPPARLVVDLQAATAGGWCLVLVPGNVAHGTPKPIISNHGGYGIVVVNKVGT